ncbi:beta-ketoacyl-[acyl-carrier-protein] synthase family protein [Mucilaginibacter gotjawali]|uniref:3-oxoacyl-[acyl-carrier-protein] synthase 2 n=2 Tax=Mucilaginibacter gotjawali TaxID=1550579 RepID=A0A0X8X202_9SPHI|nr:beta-ketoacyl synthase N-terminal-like domain-containing protein [Mucilaginibacter gotjawali]MBB3054038.1 3-oxoacyl-[acyl-carrier-protein] synthase-1 [Mucilaginibacter gotjawali]BAU54304.1 3-oxoacyl-[acyl-carrier-protein] synthase 2 [Mucilaginibacter gotjawali]
MSSLKENKGPDVFIVADNISSPLGKTTAQNFSKLKQGVSALKQYHDPDISAQPFYASLFRKDESFLKNDPHYYTKFEQLLIASIAGALHGSGITISDKKTVLIISSTKGSISLLENEIMSETLKRRIALPTSARLISKYFGFINQPIVVSNACISGVLAILTGMRLLRAGQFENAVIAGADVISKFIFSGFESFQALSPQICKPFDRLRDGLNLGEGAATVILSTNKNYSQNIKIKGGAVSNDANHISGPSRTGKELAGAIKQAMQDAAVRSADIDFISAHGTATVYNDEMEANAFFLTDLQSTPVNSLKAYYGHTLGAAGLIESIISIQSMKENLVLPTLGFEHNGVTQPLNVCNSLLRGDFKICLKTASGFGGCNGAVVFGMD